jgi:hypothetical protein
VSPQWRTVPTAAPESLHLVLVPNQTFAVIAAAYVIDNYIQISKVLAGFLFLLCFVHSANNFHFIRFFDLLRSFTCSSHLFILIYCFSDLFQFFFLRTVIVHCLGGNCLELASE